MTQQQHDLPVDRVQRNGHKSGRDGEAQRPTGRRSAEAMAENEVWLREHEADLLRAHPEWKEQWVAVASCTPSKILAVATRRIDALEEGIKSAELVEVAGRVAMHPGSLVTVALLGGNPFDV